MISQFFGEEILKKMTKTGATSLQMAAGSKIRAGGLGISFNSAENLNFGSNGIGGLDVGSIVASSLYFIYAVVSGSNTGLVASLSSTGPTGFLIFKQIGNVNSDTSSNIAKPFLITDQSPVIGYIKDVQAFGTDIDISTAAAWNIRLFNTLEGDFAEVGMSIETGNTLVLSIIGKFLIEWKMMASENEGFHSRLNDITNVNTKAGTTGRASTTVASSTLSHGNKLVDISGITKYRLEHWPQSAPNAREGGIGVDGADSGNSEVFIDIKVTRFLE